MRKLPSSGWFAIALFPALFAGLRLIDALPRFGPFERVASGLLIAGIGVAVYLLCNQMQLARTFFQVAGIASIVIAGLFGFVTASLKWPTDLKNPQSIFKVEPKP